jgi:hypothetical protein
MDRIESLERPDQGVGLMELERVVGLRVDVDAHDLEARSVIAHRCATSTAEQI